jgi:membrane complex biogenesis BtpA family protein
LEDLDTLQQGGFDGVCVENDYDRPHQLYVGPEIISIFTRVALEVRQHAKIPVGLGVLLNDWKAALAIAKVVDASFIRLDFFVDRVRIAAGVIEPQPEAILAYRHQIKAEHVALFTDVQVKYSELLEEGKSLTVSTQQAIEQGSDAVIVSGKVSGESPTMDHLREVRNAAGNFPVLIGSGTTSENVGELLRYANGAIVGTSLKNSMASHEHVVPQKVKKLMDAVRLLDV